LRSEITFTGGIAAIDWNQFGGLESDLELSDHTTSISSLVSQFDLFPERVTVDPVDARSAAGERSKVKAIFLVQFERKPGKHQVFHDRHGWYCADHGAQCPAVEAARQYRRQRPEARGQRNSAPPS
jgi:hypothetical protein